MNHIDVNKVPDESYYMIGATDLWYCKYVEGRAHIHWELLCAVLLEKFLIPDQENVVMEFTQFL